MPRDGLSQYSPPPGTEGIPNYTVESARYNAFVADVTQDLNLPRPVVAGGTGASTPDSALVNLSGEKAAHVITNYNSDIFYPGSFRSAAAATGAPVAGHAFAGVCYIGEPLADPPTNQNLVVIASDMDALTDTGLIYSRRKKAGVWGPWSIGDTGTGQAGARQAIYAAPFDALAYNGMQINGSMEVSQENGAGSVAVPAGSQVVRVVDGWQIEKTGTSVLSAFQGGNSGLSGFTKSLAFSVTTPQASIGSDSVQLTTKIEGYRVSRAAWGTAQATSITVGFWISVPLAGTYRALIHNFDFSAYSGGGVWASFTIATANTWQWVVLTFAPVTTGTWKTDNSIGMKLLIEVASSSTPNAVGTGAASVLLTGVVVLPGIEAPSAARSPLIMRPYDQELVTCQRYWWASNPTSPLGGVTGLISSIAVASNALSSTVRYTVPMRAAPTLSVWNNGLNNRIRVVNTGTVLTMGGLVTGSFDLQGGSLIQFSGGGLTVATQYDFDLVADARL